MTTDTDVCAHPGCGHIDADHRWLSTTWRCDRCVTGIIHHQFQAPTALVPDNDALRQRIETVLREAAHWCDGTCGLDERACHDQHPVQVAAWTHDIVSDLYGPIDALAAALLPLVANRDAQVLREAADWLTAEYTGPGADAAVRRAATRLRARADAIRPQDGEEA